MSNSTNQENLKTARGDHEDAQMEYLEELEKLTGDPEHYMTPGARRYFRRVAIGYVVLAAAFVIGVWATTNLLTDRIRDDINTFLVASCKANIPILEKFNAKLDVDIEIQEDAQMINIGQGQLARARLNQKAIEAARASKFDVPTEKECDQRGQF